MPYLKDCKLKTDPRVTIYYDYILDDGWNVVGLNKTGDFVAGILSMRNITGTPISDRDYRLAIARAKSQQAFDLAKMLAHLNNAKQLGELMLLNREVKQKGREMVTRINQRIDATVREITHHPALSSESIQILRRDMVNDEVTAQIEMVTTQLLALPKGTRDEIESYVNSRYNTYRLNK